MKRTGGAVKLRAEAVAALDKLVAIVSQHGWLAVGRNSTETTTKEAVASYAIECLKASIKGRA